MLIRFGMSIGKNDIYLAYHPENKVFYDWPKAGRGGSLTIDGAAALADDFEQSNFDYQQAFKIYNTGFRPFVEQLQEDVINYYLDALVPKNEDAIRKRNREGFGF